jgi:hypothetical protein
MPSAEPPMCGSSGAQTTRKVKKAHFEGFEFRYATICEENRVGVGGSNPKLTHFEQLDGAQC